MIAVSTKYVARQIDDHAVGRRCSFLQWFGEASCVQIQIGAAHYGRAGLIANHFHPSIIFHHLSCLPSE